jgi:hypothetical protein
MPTARPAATAERMSGHPRTPYGPHDQPAHRRAVTRCSKTGRQRRSLELVPRHVPAHWPALPRPAACGQQARPAAARGHRAAARPARLPRSDGASLPANRAGWLAPTRYLQPADDLAGVVHPARSRATQAPPPRRQGALIEAAILGGGLPRRPGAKATRDTAMPAHSRTLFPEWRQHSPARFPCRGPAQANRARRTPQLTPPRPAPDPGRYRPMRQCDGHWQRHHTRVTDHPLGPHNACSAQR